MRSVVIYARRERGLLSFVRQDQMLTKILITGIVIAIAYAMQRMRTRSTQEIPVVQVARAPKERAAMPKWIKPAAYGFAAVVVIASTTFYYLSWADDQCEVEIRVINTANGAESLYRAHKGDIGGRSFKTVDGLTVRIADADRFEVIELCE